MRENRSAIINASEIGLYAYCARAWWLRRVAGFESANAVELADGRRQHERHGQAVRSVYRMRGLAYVLFVAAAITTMLAILFRVRL